MGLNCFDRTAPEALNARTTAYNEGLLFGDMYKVAYKVVCYKLRKEVKRAKKRY